MLSRPRYARPLSLKAALAQCCRVRSLNAAIRSIYAAVKAARSWPCVHGHAVCALRSRPQDTRSRRSSRSLMLPSALAAVRSCRRPLVPPSTRAAVHSCRRPPLVPLSARAAVHSCRCQLVPPSARAAVHSCRRPLVPPSRSTRAMPSALAPAALALAAPQHTLGPLMPLLPRRSLVPRALVPLALVPALLVCAIVC